MAEITMKIEIKTNIHEFTAKIAAMAKHLDAASDCDPAKIAMLAFGPIDLDKHIQFDTRKVDGTITCEVVPSSELKALMDVFLARIDG